ncbi:MAG TPA: hypothetical protein VFS43_39995 [Polyangiaceae bacterium]|nr:hypothetical protein [Polyangiaceae bacterium]
MATKRGSEGQRRVPARTGGARRTRGEAGAAEAATKPAKASVAEAATKPAKAPAGRGRVARAAAPSGRGRGNGAAAAKRASARGGNGAAAAVDEAAGSEAEYERFLDAARALPKADVERLAVDPAVAYHNVKAGVEAVLAREADVRKLPGIDLRELRELPALCLGLSFAALQVDRSSDGQTRVLLREASVLRRTLMAGAEALAAAGLLPAAAVTKIREGQGPSDLADDCVALAALYRKHAPSLRGKTAVTAADLKRAAELGTELRTRLKPVRSRRPGESEAELRDRFWTLLARRYDRLWRAGAFVYGRREIDARVPPLGSVPGRKGGRRAGGEAEPPGAGGGAEPPDAGDEAGAE